MTRDSPSCETEFILKVQGGGLCIHGNPKSMRLRVSRLRVARAYENHAGSRDWSRAGSSFLVAILDWSMR